MNVLKQCIRNKKFLLSAVILVPLLFVALFGNFLISHDPLEIHYTQTLDAPSAEYPMGTDEYGRCIACRLIVGLQPTMIVAFGGTVIAMVAGSLLGLLAGYIKDAWGNAIMRVVDIILCFPSILLAMLVVGFWGSGMLNLVIVVLPTMRCSLICKWLGLLKQRQVIRIYRLLLIIRERIIPGIFVLRI